MHDPEKASDQQPYRGGVPWNMKTRAVFRHTYMHRDGMDDGEGGVATLLCYHTMVVIEILSPILLLPDSGFKK